MNKTQESTTIIDHSAGTRSIPTAEPIPSDRGGAPVSTRLRASGRIGGITGYDYPSKLELLRENLGSQAQILDDEPNALVVDCDACWFEQRPLEDLDGWRKVIRDGKLGRVSGAFAIAWRDMDGAIHLARDAVGERGLFYSRLHGGLIFASTLHAILVTGLVEPTMNAMALARYLTYGYLPGPETLITGIRKLIPGETISVRNGEWSSKRFWSIPSAPEKSLSDEDLLRRELRRELESAVLRRLPSGASVGAFLSGGVDSSLVVALARRLHAGDVWTYSVSFGKEYANELPFSSLVAEHCKTRHRIVEFCPITIRDHLDESIAMLSDPIGDPLTVPNALLFKEASQDVGVVLNGEGGDPCFGGPKNIPMLLAQLLGDGAELDTAREQYSRERTYLRAHQKCYDDLSRMLTPDLRSAIADDVLESEVAPFFNDQQRTSFIAKLMVINTSFKGAFHILHKVESVSAPFGVVARSPLFDRSVVEFAFGMPSQLKLRGSTEKYLLKEAIRDLLPPAIVDRPKSGMLVPVEAWFKGPLRNYATERLLDGLSTYGLFQHRYLENLIRGHLPGLHPRRGIKIWMLLTLESWIRSTRSVGSTSIRRDGRARCGPE